MFDEPFFSATAIFLIFVYGWRAIWNWFGETYLDKAAQQSSDGAEESIAPGRSLDDRKRAVSDWIQDQKH